MSSSRVVLGRFGVWPVIVGVVATVPGCWCKDGPQKSTCEPIATATPHAPSSLARIGHVGAEHDIAWTADDPSVDLGTFAARGDVPTWMTDRCRELVRRNPRLIAPTAAVAFHWSGAMRSLQNGGVAPAATTPEMLASMSHLANAVGSVADDRELATAAHRVAEAIGAEPLAGLPVDKVIRRLLEVAVPEFAIEDSSLHLGRRERGLARDGESLIIPASAHAGGAQGTRWRTDLVITATGGVHALVTIALLPRDRANPDPVAVEVEIDGGRSLVVEDALEALFDFDGAAALRLTCMSGSVIVTSRTYNLEGQLGSPDARTFGQFLPALSTNDAVVFGDEGRLLLLAHDPTLDRGQRTNLILVNGGVETVEVEVELFSSDGRELGEVGVMMGAWEYRQLDGVFEDVTQEVVDDGYAAVKVETPGGRVFALASVVDNLTGDPVAVPAMLRSPSEERLLHETQYVQAAAKITGVGDTDWRTDLVLNGWTGDDPGTFAVTASVAVLPRGQENTNPETELLTIQLGQSVRFDDVLGSLFETDGAASITVTPYGGAIGVSSRTYNLLGDGNSGGYPAGATFGQFMGPVGYTSSIVFGDEAWIQHLSHDPALTRGSRANLGLVNTSAREIDVEIDLYQGDGTFLGGFTQSLRQWENVQIGRVFERVTEETVEGGYAVLRTTHPAGSFMAHGSVVDNRTGDPITVDAVTLRGPEPGGVVASGDMLMLLFETGFTPKAFFELLRAGGLTEYMDDMAAAMPDRVVRTAAGVDFDLGAGTSVGGSLFASGTVRFEDGSSSDGSTVTGSVVFDFGETAVDGRAPIVQDLEISLDLSRVGSEDVVGTMSLAPAAAAKFVSDFSGWLEFDTRICELYPIGGSITFSIGGEVRTLTFTDRCDGGFDFDIPSAEFYSLGMSMRDCGGNGPAEPRTIHLVQEDERVTVDPSAPPETSGRILYSSTGRITSYDAAIGFSQKAGGGSDGERRVGVFRGQPGEGGGGYWSGIYGYSVADGDCRSSYHHGRGDPDFEPAILMACDGPCWQ